MYEGANMDWKWLTKEVIKRYCGRKPTDPYELVSTLMEDKLGGRVMAVGRQLEILIDDNEEQYIGHVDNGLTDKLWRGMRTHGLTTFKWAVESVDLVMDERDHRESGGASFWAVNHKQIDIGRPIMGTSHFASNPRIKAKEGENIGENLGSDVENQASKRANSLRFDGRDSIGWILRAGQQIGTKKITTLFC